WWNGCRPRPRRPGSTTPLPAQWRSGFGPSVPVSRAPLDRAITRHPSEACRLLRLLRQLAAGDATGLDSASLVVDVTDALPPHAVVADAEQFRGDEHDLRQAVGVEAGFDQGFLPIAVTHHAVVSENVVGLPGGVAALGDGAALHGC